jgi:hypothetical protein
MGQPLDAPATRIRNTESPFSSVKLQRNTLPFASGRNSAETERWHCHMGCAGREASPPYPLSAYAPSWATMIIEVPNPIKQEDRSEECDE